MNDELVDAAKAIASQLSSAKIRCTVDEVADKLGAKIRKAEIAKVPHMIILGKKEAEAGKISVRSRANKELENISSADDFITSLLDIINTKKLPDNQQS